jgi:hypothetical protein
LYYKIHNFLLTTSSKVRVEVMYNRISKSLDCNNILVPEHFGLREDISIEGSAFLLDGLPPYRGEVVYVPCQDPKSYAGGSLRLLAGPPKPTGQRVGVRR